MFRVPPFLAARASVGASTPAATYPTPFAEWSSELGGLATEDPPGSGIFRMDAWNSFIGSQSLVPASYSKAFLELNQLNGYPAIRFASASSAMVGDTSFTAQPVGTTIVVAKANDFGTMVLFDHFGGRQQLYGDGAVWLLYAGSSLSSGVTQDQSALIFCCRFAGDATSKIDLAAGNATGNCGAGDATKFIIGLDSTDSAQFVGDLFHITRWDTVLSDAHAKAACAVLATKYALTNPFP